MLIGLALVAELNSLRDGGVKAFELNKLLQSVRAEFKMPAMAAVIVLGGKVVAKDAVGVRKQGDETPVTINDKFHIGSCTKSMTALLASRFVQEGKLKWSTTIHDVFPSAAINASLQSVTIEQLLSHRSGIKANMSDADTDRYMRSSMSPREQRAEMVAKLLVEAPEFTPGTTYSYSNLGVTVAGAMIEKVADKPWEQLISERVFKPLHMSTAGFGTPATIGKIDQPWGHVLRNDRYEPISPGPGSDNPPAIGPAATVHCSLTDLAKYAQLYLDASKGRGKILSKDVFDKIESDPFKQDYELGWLVVQRSWGNGTVLNHAGSNTMFYTVIWIAPAQDFAMVVAANAGGDQARLATDKVVHDTVFTLFAQKESRARDTRHHGNSKRY